MHICAIQKIPSGDGMGSYKLFFLVINVFHRGLTDLPREAIRPKGSKCFSRGFLPAFLRKHITTCVFPGGGGGGRTHVMHWSIFYFPQPFPSFQLTKTLGIVNADLITEYVLGYIIALERKYFTATQFQSRREWNM